MKNYTPPVKLLLPGLLLGCPVIASQAQSTAIASIHSSPQLKTNGKASFTQNNARRSLASVLEDFKAQHKDVSFFYRTDIVANKFVSAERPAFKTWQEELAYIVGQSNLQVEKMRDDLYIISPASTFGPSGQSIADPIEEQQAPAVVVKGKVTGTNNEGLPGTTVVVKGTTVGTSTDVNGEFSLSVPDANATLVVSSIGFVTQEIPLNGRTTLTIALESDTKALDEVVVVGYGALRREDVTGSISTVKAEDIRTEGSNTLTRSLQGRVAGVQIESSTGAPGAGLRVLVRGAGSFNNTNPLYVVDGVWVDNINYLQPSDIASIDVLKDASAASIYGAQGANGVVLITTKSGKKGPIKLDANAYYGAQKIVKTLDVLNAREWATVSNAAHANAPGTTPLAIAKDPDALGEGTDWQKEIYHVAPIQNYTVGASGGGDNYNFSISGGYFGQKGIVKETNYTRLNLRIKSDFTKGRLKLGESIIMSQEYWRYTAGGWGGQGGNPSGSALKMIPAFSVYDPTALGGFSGASGPVVNVANPVAMLYLEKPENRNYNAIINAYAEISLIEGLKYKYNLGYTPGFSHYSSYTYPYQVGTLFPNADADLNENRSQSGNWLHENTLTYAKTFGKHGLNVLAGYTFRNNQYRYLGAAKSNIPLGLQVIDAGNLNPVASSNGNESTTISYLGRLVYSFNDRYVFTGTFRRDGSSRFGPDYRYGDFPSVALAWNAINEPFFQPLQSVVSNLKVRASYGVLGNQNFNDYLYYSTIVPNTNYVIGTGQTLWGGAIQVSLANEYIKWEETKSSNVGIDWGFFDNKLSLTTDYFVRKSEGAIIGVPIAGSNGSLTNPVFNAGTISNRGFEVALNYTSTKGDFTYTLLGTATAIRSKVDELATGSQQIFGGQPTFQGAQATVGQAGIPLGAFFLIKTDGIFQSQEEVDAYAIEGRKIQPNAKPGDIRFVDYNNDGQISQADRQLLGDPTPDLSYGFGGNLAWKGFDLSVYLQGTYGNKIYNGVRQDLEGMNLEQNYGKATLNAWTPDNPNTDVPRAVINDPNGNGQTSSRFLENGSYLRFKTLQFGYTLPASAIGALKVTSCRVYVSADNLFTITKYKGYNPDLGRSEGGTNILDRGVDRGYGIYPLQRTALAGIQLSF
ncbi:TonB-dependent receptor [Hymenobacter sp.]|jgi:TonB-linked SusC/RagA family outer membrane protein|uniref:SusC/RagA family TonB-linked outer membrane protein n=1 Tax=Hymenobacter sp. TaxID=1898978 RepID=UPI002EDAE026